MVTYSHFKARLRNVPNEARNAAARGLALLKGNGIAAYWYNYYNAGDQLTPLLLRHYGYTPYCVLPEQSAIASVGSLLEDLPPDYLGIILGSGFIRETSRMSFPRARILAVRGHLTRERLGLAPGSVALGDPGLLVSKLLPKRRQKRFRLGLIPHYVDLESPALARLCKRYPGEVKLVRIKRHQPMRVVEEIDQCEHILSSSLHGLILADSLGIPNAWFYSEGITGGRFKYDDYYSALGLSNQLMHRISGNETLQELLSWTSLKRTAIVEAIKKDLDKAFARLSELHPGWKGFISG